MTLLNPAEHKSILVRMLKDIYNDKNIAPFLGFKGGTAVFLFYDLDRFSTDLDFDLLKEDKKDDVYSSIKKILASYGQIKEARIKRYSLFFLLSYQNHAHNIKIEINLRNFGSQYELKQYLGISMLVMKKEDMFAHKLVAMYERLGKANRDIYDVHFFLKKDWKINEAIVEERSRMTFKQFLKQCVDALKKMNNRNILSGIGEVLTVEQKRQVKANLLEDTIFLLNTRV